MSNHNGSNRSSETSTAVDALQAGTWDVLVIGGGIVGAGVARDAALRGLRVALTDQGDFASGTSSRSSRLLHGGIRYLAQGRIGLVREASREKTIIRDIAPHLAEPLAFVFPTRKGDGWPRWQLAIGVKVYDLLCGRQNLGPSSVLGRQRLLDLVAGLSDDRLTGGVRYFDALTNDARLTLDTLRSAAAAGAAIANYVKFEGAVPDNSGWNCQLRCILSDKSLSVATRTVVNATGPWSDRIPLSGANLRLTKGVHLVIDRTRLPIDDAVVMTQGQRILFGIPWGERVILGTTDTDYDGPVATPVCEPEDVDYILGVVNGAFPAANLRIADVISTWAGLRPLVADRNGKPSDISRRHEIRTTHPGWWDATGGKLTTYRLMAEEAVDAVVEHLGGGVSQSTTATQRLLSTDAANEISGILPPPIKPEVVEHCCRREWAVHLDDVMIRRTGWRHYHRDHAEIAERVSRWMQSALAWGDEARSDELHRYLQLVDSSAAVSLQSASQDNARPPC